MYGVGSSGTAAKEKAKGIFSNVLRFVSSPQEATAMVSAAVGPAQAKALEAKIKADRIIKLKNNN